MSYGRMKKAEPELAREVQRWLREAEATDAREDEEYGPERRGDELPDWVQNKQKRLEKIREAKAALEAEAAAQRGPDDDADDPPPPPAETRQRNFTDPESRIMKGPDGFVQAYNTQVAVDAEHQVIVAQLVTNQPTDVGHLPPLVAQIKTNTGRQAGEVSADAATAAKET